MTSHPPPSISDPVLTVNDCGGPTTDCFPDESITEAAPLSSSEGRFNKQENKSEINGTYCLEKIYLLLPSTYF